MKANPLLRRLGLDDDARAVIIHTDDIGMCQASVSAFLDLIEFGLISSAATMVPCPWFPAVAAVCRANPRIDMGVHLTLNSEWDMYRWGPISTREVATGLIDKEGYLYRRQPPVEEHAESEAVTCEITAQVERALSAGIDVTHIDTHMGTLLHHRFVSSYLQIALQHRLPLMMPRKDEAGYQTSGMDQFSAAHAASMASQFEELGLPLLDAMLDLPLDQSADRVEVAKRVLSQVPVGVTHFAIHPCHDTPELRAIAPDWPSRVADYRAFTSEELHRWVKDSGLVVIGYRDIRTAMRAGV